MIKQIDRDLIDRTSKAIANVRKLASSARKPKILQAIQAGETLVIVIDDFRKFCKYNEGRSQVIEYMTVFKRDEASHAIVANAFDILKGLYKLVSVAKRKGLADEYRQVELLLTDVSDYITVNMSNGVPHA